jgi:HlyD family secretion protein
VASGSATNAPAAQGTNSTQGTAGKKQGEAARPIEVVFLKDGERAKMVPVKRGISDDSYTEITEGVADGQEVVAGGYKVISKDLEEGKKVQVGPAKGEAPKEKK